MKHYIIFLVSIFLTCCFAPQVFAATSITIKETQPLTFPMIGLPATGTRTLAISPLNSSTSGTGQIVSGTASRGTYALTSKGTGGISISIDISGINTGNAGLTLSDFRGFYDGLTIDSFPSTTLPIPAQNPGSTPLYIGATETVNTSVTPGSYTGSFTITVFVQ